MQRWKSWGSREHSSVGLNQRYFWRNFLQSPPSSLDFSTGEYLRHVCIRLLPNCYSRPHLTVLVSGWFIALAAVLRDLAKGASHKSSVPSGVTCRVKLLGFCRPNGRARALGLLPSPFAPLCLGVAQPVLSRRPKPMYKVRSKPKRRATLKPDPSSTNQRRAC